MVVLVRLDCVQKTALIIDANFMFPKKGQRDMEPGVSEG
jgi:hypothetical protein